MFVNAFYEIFRSIRMGFFLFSKHYHRLIATYIHSMDIIFTSIPLFPFLINKWQKVEMNLSHEQYSLKSKHNVKFFNLYNVFSAIVIDNTRKTLCFDFNEYCSWDRFISTFCHLFIKNGNKGLYWFSLIFVVFRCLLLSKKLIVWYQQTGSEIAVIGKHQCSRTRNSS
jgi:hypothetical protein